MSDWALRFQGVGSAAAVELGSAMATLERDGRPWLTIDCGGEGLSSYLTHYGEIPGALFVTHTHLDHVGGFERLFVGAWFDERKRRQVKLYVPAPVVPLLHRRVGDYPNVLAEGGVNFWDAFHLTPVTDAFWHDGVRLEVFPVRHHWPDTAFGLRLPGSLVWTGDTRPIPDALAKYAGDGELIAHECGWAGNPSHTGVDDLEREYPPGLQRRLLLYHYGSREEGAKLAECGYRVAQPGDVVSLQSPKTVQGTFAGE